MRTKLLACLLCCVPWVLLGADELCLPEPSVSVKLVDNTVMLTDGFGWGSGVLVSHNGTTFVWTAAHVADIFMQSDGGFKDIVVIQGDKVGAARVLRCADFAVSYDCALLEIVEGNFSGTAEFYRTFNQTELGQMVVVCGHPFTRECGRVLSYGAISQHDGYFEPWGKIELVPVDYLNIDGWPGCSGGPVADLETGKILGLEIGGFGYGLAVMTPTRHLYEFAKSHDCLWAFDPEVPMPDRRIAWRGDAIDRLIAERDTSVIDQRWGDQPEEE